MKLQLRYTPRRRNDAARGKSDGGREGGIQGLNVDDDGHDHNNKERTRPRYAIQVAVETSEDRRNRNETGWPPTLPSHNAFVLCRVLEYSSYSAGAPVKIVPMLCP